MSRPAIVHMISSPARGAPREIMLRLVAAIERDRYRPGVVFLREGWDEIEAFGLDSMLADFEALDVPICIAGMERATDVGGAVALDRFLRGLGTRLIVSHLNRADLWAAAMGWWGRAPTVRVVHGLEPWRTARPPDPRWLLRVGDRALNARAARIVCVSKESRRLLVEYQHVPPGKITWIPGGIDIDRYRAPSPPFPPGRAPTIGIVSRLHEDKGVFEFVDAAAAVQKARPGTRVLVAGDGPDADEMRRRTVAAGAKFEYLGQVSDVPAVLAEIDVWILPSHHEGTPLALLEAMAAGRAIVASDVGGIPHVLEHGAAGVLVPVGDASALAEATIELTRERDRARALGDVASRIVEAYSVGEMCRGYARLYDELLSNVMRARADA